jgi:hypothetical protein
MENKIEINNKIEKANKPFVSEENRDIIDSWYKRASEVTPETFGELINELLHDYDLDYGAKIHAAAACTIAMFNACDDIFGFSGFQSSASIMQVLYKLNYPCNKTGIRVLNYDDMLYPQYEDKFRSISRDTWKLLRKRAGELVDENDKWTTDPSVFHHWSAISLGIVPFGYYISD